MTHFLLALVLAAVGQQQTIVNNPGCDFPESSWCLDYLQFTVSQSHLGSRTPVTLEPRVYPPPSYWGGDIQPWGNNLIGQEIDINLGPLNLAECDFQERTCKNIEVQIEKPRP